MTARRHLAIVSDEDLSWQAAGHCRTLHPDPRIRARIMYPDDDAGVERARRVCSRCEVQAECLAHALNHGERYGVWGGFTPEERRQAVAS